MMLIRARGPSELRVSTHRLQRSSSPFRPGPLPGQGHGGGTGIRAPPLEWQYTNQGSFIRNPLRAALAFGLVAALAGCAAPPIASSTEASAAPTASSTPSPTQTQASEPSHLVISSTDIQIYLQDGSLAETINYFDPIDPAVARLTELFGAEPAVNTYDGTGAADYEWPGFRLGTDGPATPLIGPELSVRATADEVSNIQVGTTDGTQVGDDLRPISAADPTNSSVYPNGNGETLSVQIGLVPVEPGDSERAFYTTLSADPADGIIDQIHAPGKNFE